MPALPGQGLHCMDWKPFERRKEINRRQTRMRGTPHWKYALMESYNIEFSDARFIVFERSPACGFGGPGIRPRTAQARHRQASARYDSAARTAANRQRGCGLPSALHGAVLAPGALQPRSVRPADLPLR